MNAVHAEDHDAIHESVATCVSQKFILLGMLKVKLTLRVRGLSYVIMNRATGELCHTFTMFW